MRRAHGAEQVNLGRYLSTDDYRTDTRTWATEQGLNIIHLPIDVSKDPTVEVDEALVRQAIEAVLGECLTTLPHSWLISSPH